MVFSKITTAEKVKIFDKMLAQVKQSTKYSTEDSLDDDIYYACKVAGCQIFNKEISEKIEA